MLPNDQMAWLGLADAYRHAENAKEAEDAYLKAVQINPHNQLAEAARAGSNLLAQSGFDQTKQIVSRQDAVYYCLEAIKRFAQMPEDKLKKVTLELAINGSVLSIIVLTGGQALSPLGHGEKTAHSISRGDLPRHEPRGSA